MTLTFQDDRASLTLSGGPSPLDFDLSKVPGPEAASRLRALTLGLAERLCSLERQLAGKRGWWWGGWGGSHIFSQVPLPAPPFLLSPSCGGGDIHQPPQEPLAGGLSALLAR